MHCTNPILPFEQTKSRFFAQSQSNLSKSNPLIPFVAERSLKILLTHSEHLKTVQDSVKATLTVFLKNHFATIAKETYVILLNTLQNQQSALKVKPLIKLIFDQVVFNSLPEHFKKMFKENEEDILKKIEKHAPLFLTSIKGGIEDFLSHPEFHDALIKSLVETIAPYFLCEPADDISAKQKQMILSALDGIELFYEDLNKALKSETGSFDIPIFDALTPSQCDIVENNVLSKMIESQQQRGLSSEFPYSFDKENMEKNLFLASSTLLKTFSPISLGNSKTEESALFFSSLCLSKFAEVVFSSFTMLHFYDKLLNLHIPSDKTEPDSADQISAVDRQFAKNLSERYHNLCIHAARMGSSQSINQFLLVALTHIIMVVIKKPLGISAACSLKEVAHTESWENILAWIDMLFDDAPCRQKESSLLTCYFQNKDVEIKHRLFQHEEKIEENKLYDKINGVIKDKLSNQFPYSKVNLHPAAWKYALIADSKIIKSLCRNFTHTLFAFIQRDRLLKMLYWYIAEAISKK